MVGAGEAEHVAARRELAEELGIEGVSLTPCFTFRYTDGGNFIHGSAFLADYDGPLVLQEDEVADATWLTVEAALALEDATPDSCVALERMLAQGWLMARDD